MYLLSLVAVFLFCSTSVFTQNINVSIRDINNNLIVAVDILNKDKEIIGESNEFSQFVVDKNTIIGLSKAHRVYKGYLYYLEIDNDFYRIKRSRLPNH